MSGSKCSKCSQKKNVKSIGLIRQPIPSRMLESAVKQAPLADQPADRRDISKITAELIIRTYLCPTLNFPGDTLSWWSLFIQAVIDVSVVVVYHPSFSFLDELTNSIVK